MYQYIIEGTYDEIRQAVNVIDKLFRQVYNIYGAYVSYKKTYAIVQVKANWYMNYDVRISYIEIYKRLISKFNRLGYTFSNNIIWKA